MTTGDKLYLAIVVVRGDRANEVETLVPRQQVAVLRRQVIARIVNQQTGQ